MKGSNLGKLLVVATLAAKRLDLCKDTRDPSCEMCLSRRLSFNFDKIIPFSPFRVSFYISKHVFVEILAFVSQWSTYFCQVWAWIMTQSK
jgi:hypothetical protein